MISTDLAMGIIFLSQTALGILGNSALLCCLIISEFSVKRARPTDLIVKHLTSANFMVLLCKGIPQTLAALGWKYFLNTIACKIVFYFHRVARGVSLGSTALLGFFQAIIINPRNAKYKYFKATDHKVIGTSLSLCWSLQMMVNGFIPVLMTDLRDAKNVTGFRDLLYCAVPKPSYAFYVILLSSSDVMCLVLMIWACGSMVLVLLKHKQRLQYMHRVLCPKSSPETRATQTILVLVSSFVFFYTASGILVMCLTLVNGATRHLVNTSAATAACFPALCPYLLIRHYTPVSRLCCTC
ncbi:vomeronasal type-1 receptor 4-like [Cricetulus griseus]|uniref:Vomeronasal type-1 receptor n=1 Tax=Cricetulus griseus TaxID=10029 RepID=A0A9J7HCL7_CRIGR|nr:vomeronasal type-1 receptor 4-like [Cricetulus griseus]XP_035309573.1 vomeronasal type-1 receptor 4-like [Cricetulus griseus]